MKNFILTFLILFPLIGFGQEIPDDFQIKFQNLVCECLQNEQNHKKDLFINCLTENMNLVEKEFETFYTISGFESSNQFGEQMMLQSQEDLIDKCPSYIKMIENMRLEGFEEIKTLFDSNPSLSIESLNSKIIDSNSAENYQLRGLYYFANKNYDLAKIDFQKVIELDSTYLDSKFYLGMLYETIGDLENALLIYNDVHTKSDKKEYYTALLIIKKKLKKD